MKKTPRDILEKKSSKAMNKKLFLSVLTIMLLVVSLASGFASCKPYVLPENKELPIKIKEQITPDTESLDLKSVTDFEWDTVYVIGQYMPVEEVLKQDGVQYVLMTNQYNDGFLLVFCLDKKIVAYCNLYSDVIAYGLTSDKKSRDDSVVVIRNERIVEDGWTSKIVDDGWP